MQAKWLERRLRRDYPSNGSCCCCCQKGKMMTQKTQVVHCKIDAYDVYIGRGSKWGNPFTHKSGTTAKFQVDTRDEAIAKYREWIMKQPELLDSIHELRGKRLGCWCKIPSDPGRPCHGDVLADLADNAPEDGYDLPRIPFDDFD